MFIAFSRTLFSNHRLFAFVPYPRSRFYLSLSPMSTAAVKRVGTHHGSFHCDEALGCFMIRLTKRFSDAHIVRTRDPKVLETLDAVLDVGGIYDPTKDRYDHHQKGFEEVFGHGFNTKLSSAGLVYKHFGKEIIAKELQVDEDHPDVHRLFLAVYKSFMELMLHVLHLNGTKNRIRLPDHENLMAIDAIDNGINQFDTDQPPRYMNNTHLSSRVGKLNLDWIDPDQSPEKENEAFERAMVLAGSEFLDWKLHLFELEEEMKISPPIKYVLYQNPFDGSRLRAAIICNSRDLNVGPTCSFSCLGNDWDDRSKSWRVQAVGIAPDRFECRKALPAQWRGLRDDELSKETGIPGGVFVHMSGFIGGNQTYDGALAMAKAALKL
ncbi:UNVERIFIED_CONTAM: hypothetical protein Slati_4428600 [Sesamum latifolium]|uniref:Metal-dependent protein hydrolase n=1 Tax=Sesamum latifolium TaxID=2727402 RepID=A0AAW2SR59_9LAMI